VKHLAQLLDFERAIRERAEAPVTIHNARRVLRVTDAIFASDRAGAPVRILQWRDPSR
jgi:predicted dehydrogenase